SAAERAVDFGDGAFDLCLCADIFVFHGRLGGEPFFCHGRPGFAAWPAWRERVAVLAAAGRRIDRLALLLPAAPNTLAGVVPGLLACRAGGLAKRHSSAGLFRRGDGH